MDFDFIIKGIVKQEYKVFSSAIFSGARENTAKAACCKIAIQTQSY